MAKYELAADKADLIRKAAVKIMEDAPGLCEGNAMYGLAAMCLAASTAAAYARMDYGDLIGLISSYYESTLTAEIKLQMGEDFLKPPGKPPEEPN